ETGFRFIPEDEDSLLNSLENCLKLTTQEKLIMASNGKKLVVERSNVNEMIKTFIKTFSQIL
ncbi:MAG: hypothetical protein P1P73_11980, partial [Brevefilum sp.]|nr:hypothetical protein [Brevefilum sp.]